MRRGLSKRLGTSVLVLLALSIGPAAASDAPRLPQPRPLLGADAKNASDASTISPAPAALSGDFAPIPRPRPATAVNIETVLWAEGVESRFRSAVEGPGDMVEPSDVPADQARTADAVAAVAALPRPRPRPASSPQVLALVVPQALIPVLPVLEPADPACLGRLRALGVAFSEEAPIDFGGPCNVDHPLNVTSLGSGVMLEPTATLNCRTAESLAKWAKETVVPAAEKHLAATPDRIVHASAYVCRPLNNEAGAKLSEHAHANAADIAAIGFADRAPIEIGATAGAEARFEAEIRKGACDHFTTVLGPGSDASHARHFHFDMAERRGDYRLCELGESSVARAP